MKHDPKYSSCCGYEATGVLVDIGICGDCKDHCTYDDLLDEDEDDYMMNPPQPEDFENITGEEKDLSDEDFPTYVDDLI